MNVNKVKPYLFWIVCGIILILEIAVFSLVRPSIEEAPQLTAADAKSQLDAQMRDFEKLKNRAEKTRDLGGGGTDPFDPESARERDELLTAYVVTDDWVQYLEAIVTRYEEQLASIRRELADRSRSMSMAISEAADRLEWYTSGYEPATVELLRRLIDARLIAVPSDRAGDPKFLAENLGVRNSIGLFTRGDDWPPVSMHAELTTRFRLIERLTGVLSGVQATPVANPLHEGFVPTEPEPERVLLRSLSFAGTGGGVPITHRIRLELQGSPNVLLAALRAIDSLTEPITTRLDSTWQRLGDLTADRAIGRADLPMRLTTEVIVMDFSALGGGQ